MDAPRFDALTRTLSAGSRRALLGVLLALPGLGSLLAILVDPDAVEAKKRHKNRRRRHKHGQGRPKNRRKKNTNKSKKRCKPKSRARTCAGTCGIVKNKQTCKKRVDCGSCACEPPCAVCFTCQEGPNTPGVCVPDAATVGEACGAPGQVCLANGTCGCGDVCAEGCQFGTIGAAIEAAKPGDVIRICAGVYKEHLTIPIDLTLIGAGQGLDGTVLDGSKSGVVVTNQHATVALQRLRVTGGKGLNTGGVLNDGALKLTGCIVTDNEVDGGGQSRGGGIYNAADLTLIDSSVTLNKAIGGVGGGIYGRNLSNISLTDSSVSGNQAGSGGGIYSFSGNITLSGTSSVTGNTATNGEGAGGGIFHAFFGEVTLSATSRVCDNDSDQCVGFSAPPGVCVAVCPA